MKIITIVARKGGVGKTTFTYLEALYLSQNLKKRVLVIDGDPQANLTSCFTNKEQENKLGELFKGKDIESCVQKTILHNLDIIPCNIFLDDLNQELVAKPVREKWFFNILVNSYKWLEEHYDYVLIDTNPSLSLVNQNLMLVANDILIISDRSKFSLEGIARLFNIWKAITEALNTPFNMETIILNKINNTSTSDQFIDAINKLFSKKVLNSNLHEYVTIEKSVISKHFCQDLKRLERLGNPLELINNELIERGVL